MGNAGEFQFDIGADGFGRLRQEMAGANEAAKKSTQVFKRAFAADVFVTSLSRITQALDGAAKQSIESVSTIAQGFLVAGPAGGAMASFNVLVGEGIRAWKAYADAAAEPIQATAEQIANSAKATAEWTKKLQDVKREIQAIRLADASGISVSRALGMLSTAEVQTALANQETMIAGLRRNLAAAREDAIKQAAALSFFSTDDLTLANDMVSSRKRAIAVAETARETLIAQAALLREQERKARVEEANRIREEKRGLMFDLVEIAGESAAREQEARAEAELEEEADERFFEQQRAAEAIERARAEEAEWQRTLATSAEEEHQRAMDRNSEQAAARFGMWALEQEQRAQADADHLATFESGLGLARLAVDVAGDLRAENAEALKGRAKEAAFEAAFYAAKGIAELIWNPPGAVASFVGAGKFALLAATYGIGASTAPSGGASAGSGGSAGAPGGRGGSVGGGPRTIGINAGQALTTTADLELLIARASREGERRLGG